MEKNLVGFWPLTDHHEGLEAYGLLSSLKATGFTYELSRWLNRPVVSGGSAAMLDKRLFSSVSIYQVDFTIAFHVEIGTVGPVIEWENGAQKVGLSIGLLPNATVQILSLVAKPVNFPNCIPTNFSQFQGHDTYRVVITYNYTAGILNVWANDEKCSLPAGSTIDQDMDGNVQVGQLSLATMAGFKIRQSIDKTLNKSINQSHQSKWFCLFIFDSIIDDSSQMETLSRICKDVSDMTPRYGGVNNMIYKPFNLRGFWPMGRDLGGIDISGHDHHGDPRLLSSWAGPTGLPYSASHFHGSRGVYKYGHVNTRRTESWETMIGARGSVTFSCWFFAQPNWKMGLDVEHGIFSMGDTHLLNSFRDIEPVRFQFY